MVCLKKLEERAEKKREGREGQEMKLERTWPPPTSLCGCGERGGAGGEQTPGLQARPL